MERESRMLEFKREISDYTRLARTVVAFANGDGGRIIIGVDDGGAVAGLSDEEVEKHFERLPIALSDCIQPPFFPQLYERTIDDKMVLVVQVFPGQQKPYFIASEGIEKGVYIRVGAHTKRAEGEVLEELRLLRSRFGYDEQPVSVCGLKELDLSPLPQSLRNEKALLSLDIIRRDPFSGNVNPTRAGILMFHPEPRRYVPEAAVIISRMRGDTGRDTVETHELTESLPAQLSAALEYLGEWLGLNPEVRREKYTPAVLRIPPEVLREVLGNALFHRQYSIAGSTKVAMYADRVEVFSPGHFAGPFIPEALGDGTSYIRNRVVALVARRLGLIEKRGTGIRMVIDRTAALGAPARFVEGSNWFKVVLPFPVEALTPASDPGSKVMALFEIRTEINSSSVCRLLGVSKATAVGVLEKLIVAEKIRRIGNGPRTRYVATGY
jgi:ATP-dependent DNA helicase RecG